MKVCVIVHFVLEIEVQKHIFRMLIVWKILKALLYCYRFCLYPDIDISYFSNFKNRDMICLQTS